LPKFKTCIATQDWHPLKHQSFAKEHGKEPFSQGEVGGILQTLWPQHCVQHTFGARLVPFLEKSPSLKIIQKGFHADCDSYSAFFDNARKHETSLHSFLQESKIEHLYVAGLAMDYCVYYSIIDALSLGYKVSLFLNGVRGINLQRCEEIYKELQEKGVIFMTNSSFHF